MKTVKQLEFGDVLVFGDTPPAIYLGPSGTDVNRTWPHTMPHTICWGGSEPSDHRIEDLRDSELESMVAEAIEILSAIQQPLEASDE